MKKNQLKLGAVLSYAQMAVNILIGLLYTPAMLKLLGQSEYGLYNTVVSTISMLSILSLGFNSSYIRYYAEYKASDDQKKIDNLNGVFLTIFSLIGLLALFCGLYMTFHLELVFDQGLTASEYETARILMLVMTVNLAISFPMSTFTSIISAHERYVFLKLVGILKTCLSPLLTIPLLILGYRSVALVVVTAVVSVLTDVIYLIYSLKVLHIRFCFRGSDRRMVQSLFHFSLFIAIHIVVDQINNNMDKFLLGRYVGTEEVAVYSVGYNLYHYYMLFSVGISSVFSPRVHHIVNATQHNKVEQRTKLTELFVKIGRLQFLLLGLICSGLVFFGKAFIAFWAGPGYEVSYSVALLLIIPATVPFIQNVGIEIQRALNKHQTANVFYLGMAILNLLVSIRLCQKYGAIGCAIGTAASFVIANGIGINIYYHKACNVDVIVFWKNILKMMGGLIAPVIVGVIMNAYIAFDSILVMLVCIGGYTLVYGVSMWLIGINKYEKGLVQSAIMKRSAKPRQ